MGQEKRGKGEEEKKEISTLAVSANPV